MLQTIRKTLLVLLPLLFGMTLYPAFASESSYLWKSVEQGNYGETFKLAVKAAEKQPEYYCIAAVCAYLTRSYQDYNIYRNRYLKQGSNDKLQKLLYLRQKISNNHPQLFLVRGIMATLFPESGLGDAKFYLKKAEARLKDNPYLNDFLGNYELNHHNLKTAEKYLNSAIRAQPDYPEAYISLALVYHKQNQVDQAIEVLIDAFEHCPVLPEKVYLNLANLVSSEMVLTIQPYRGQSRIIPGPALRDQYREQIKTKLQKYPKHLLGLAENFAIRGSAASAFSLLEGIDFEQDTGLANYVLLHVYNLQGNFDQARLTCRYLLGIGYADYLRLAEAGKIFLYSRDYELALACYNEALKNANQEDYDFLFRNYSGIATCYYYQQDFQNAIGYLVKALQYNPRNLDTILNIGLIYREAGNKLKAKEYFSKALQVTNDRQKRKEITALIQSVK